MMQGSGVKLIRENLDPSQVFWTFFLLGPALAALLQVLFLNVDLMPIWVGSFRTSPQQAGIPLWLLAMAEASGLIGAIFVFLFGLPASLLVAVCAISSYLVLRRVSFLVVLVAVLAALWLEEYFLPDYYTGYLASHGLRGPWTPGEPSPAPRRAVILCWVLHFVPAFICFWLVRNKRLPPV
jgi:hypothetical protein